MINYQETEVKVTIGKNPDGTKKFATGKYQQVVKKDITTDDILTLLQDPKTAKELISDYWYGHDSLAKGEVRQEVLKLQPASLEKTFAKQVQLFMQTRAANGKPVTEEQATKIVTMMNEMAESESVSA